eukprot:TRINITY_DN7801_c0_g4_i1.p1 TRINITY_DN7801_c0_g4~~TRINITY_DN7801_c0_g4_i1.p1  ORF type:complete len:255 (-),score=74.26 TRINITY_DN7801_c0_g4_i1:137-901(-)
MARNEEKAQSMLNRWLAYKREEESGRVKKGRPGSQPRLLGPSRRPALASNCNTVQDCEKWRMEILREVGRKVMEIQNDSLGEQKIRDLNDEINKLLREKGHWERRIIELGGPNYRKFERIANDALMAELEPSTDSKGYVYKYFGAAKSLPGVKEMFARSANEKVKRKRFDYKGIDAEYYGYGDEEDEFLLKQERESEEKELKDSIAQWETDTGLKAQSHFIPEESFTFVPVPSREEVEQSILEKKKRDLLKRFA